MKIELGFWHGVIGTFVIVALAISLGLFSFRSGFYSGVSSMKDEISSHLTSESNQ